MNAASPATRDLLVLAKAYATHEMRTVDALSGRVFRKGGVFKRLAAGGDVMTATHAAAVTWFDDHWPGGLAWPDGIVRPSGKPSNIALPEVDPEFMAWLAVADIWKSGRRPWWWEDLEVRQFLTVHCRQGTTLRVAQRGKELFGARCPKKSAIHDYWVRVQAAMADYRAGRADIPRPTPKKEAA